MVARGEAEIGFQQVSELKPIAGIDLVGPLPSELQKITIFSAGIVVGAREPDAARALIAFLASPAAAAAIKASGMEPMSSAAPESKRMFEKSCELQVHRMRYRLHPSFPEAEVSTYSTEFEGSQDFSNTLLAMRCRGRIPPSWVSPAMDTYPRIE